MVRLFDTPQPVRSGQLSIDDLGTQLVDVSFVVVDLETTGTQAGQSEITEIGAVRVRGGEVLGEFATLVRPERTAISPFVQRLTGISNAMVADAPELSAVLPQFLEFARGSVLVAHNAGFDIGFLRRACAELDYMWPHPPVLDTVRLSRLTVGRDEVRNYSLSTLARFFRLSDTPTHRALDDARATVGVLHGIFERLGAFGVFTLEETMGLRARGVRQRAGKRHLAASVPSGPGVYLFLDGSRRVLYVGRSQDMRTRVTSYFTAGETRGRMNEMVAAAQSVETIATETELEAAVREIRLIAQLSPPYNRRSKNPESESWVRLTGGAFPRLSVTRDPDKADGALGPFRNSSQAQRAKALLNSIFPVKTCTQAPGSARFSPCAAGEIGRCTGPCAGEWDSAGYRKGIDGLYQLAAGYPLRFAELAYTKLAHLAQANRYEEASEAKRDISCILHTMARDQQSQALSHTAECVFLKDAGGVAELAVIRFGRLAASCRVPVRPEAFGSLDAIVQSAEYVDSSTPTLSEETQLIMQWCSSPDVRLISCSSPLALHARGAGHFLAVDPRLSRG